MFDDMSEDEEDSHVEVTADDELEDFWSQPVETKRSCPDPLKWWHNNRARYPRVSRMALDYLTIPGKRC